MTENREVLSDQGASARIDEAIEALGSLVSSAGGRGYDALDVVKDLAAENERLRAALAKIAQGDYLDTGAVRGRRNFGPRMLRLIAARALESARASDETEPSDV